MLRTGIVIFYPPSFPSNFNSNVVQSVVVASFCGNQSAFENSQTPLRYKNSVGYDGRRPSVYDKASGAEASSLVAGWSRVL